MKPVRVLEEAVADLELARDFYDRQEPGIGDYFVETLLGEIASLERLHGFHKVHWGAFRLLSRRFPYGIFYLDSEEEIQVIAVLDLRRKPSRLKRDLRARAK
jgi:plasmid stabilization system protein ParE